MKSNINICFSLYFMAILFVSFSVNAQLQKENDFGWWPEQKAPSKLVKCVLVNSKDNRSMILAESISGLVAQALNNENIDEGVWIQTDNPNYDLYYNSLLKRLKIKNDFTYGVWNLVNRYKSKNIIKGYILYDYKRNDNSINLATIQAALKKGILVDISQEKQAIKRGLNKLYDATKVNFDKALIESLKLELNSNLLVIANPKFPNNRDYAIAHKSFVYYGVDDNFYSIVKWIKPISPIIGWNSGDEYKHINPCTEYGLINTASDWCMNLPMISVKKGQSIKKIKSLNPKDINWKKNENFHSFVMSDGDNMQWAFGGFINNKNYWGNLYNSSIPMSFTSCPLNLSLAAPDVYDYLVERQMNDVSVVEFGGGYYYPDHFAKLTDDPLKHLRKYASKINMQMKQTGVKVLGFICKDVFSKEAREAYKVFVEELEDITGIIVFQYNPYNGGKGEIFWVKNKLGIEIPVLTAKYQLWANLNKEGSGNSAIIANCINEDNLKSTSINKNLNWTIVHAWSRYSKNENGDIIDLNKKDPKGIPGVTPVQWTKELVKNGTEIVSIEELIWRLRMKHNSEETKKIISSIQ